MWGDNFKRESSSTIASRLAGKDSSEVERILRVAGFTQTNRNYPVVEWTRNSGGTIVLRFQLGKASVEQVR